jgi:hypothetical protein
MTEQNLTKIGSRLSINKWPEWEWFETEVALTKETLNAASRSALYRHIFPYLDSVNDSLESFRLLVRNAKLRDSYVIARVIYETAVNVCFVLTDSEVLTARANTHAKQKTLRGLVRAIEIAGDEIFSYKMHGAEDLMKIPRHQEALTSYTSKSGREITSWTPENVQERLDAIYRKFGRNKAYGLMLSLLLYRHSSEIAHGTLYGTLFSWGATEVGEPMAREEDIGNFRYKELRQLLKFISHTLESVMAIICPLIELSEIPEKATRARTDFYKDRGNEK